MTTKEIIEIGLQAVQVIAICYFVYAVLSDEETEIDLEVKFRNDKKESVKEDLEEK